jgi:pilus assembly protein Flp/PilA
MIKERRMIATLKTMIRDEEAATMVEYGLLVALVGLAAIIGTREIGHAASGAFTAVSNSI